MNGRMNSIRIDIEVDLDVFASRRRRSSLSIFCRPDLKVSGDKNSIWIYYVNIIQSDSIEMRTIRDLCR